MKCNNNNCKRETKYVLCDMCWDSLAIFENTLPKRKQIYFYIMQDEDKFHIIKKCEWKNKRFVRKYFRNYFNWCWYMSSVKNKLWKYYRLKI